MNETESDRIRNRTSAILASWTILLMAAVVTTVVVSIMVRFVMLIMQVGC